MKMLNPNKSNNDLEKLKLSNYPEQISKAARERSEMLRKLHCLAFPNQKRKKVAEFEKKLLDQRKCLDS